jgi:hypothetical protein
MATTSPDSPATRASIGVSKKTDWPMAIASKVPDTMPQILEATTRQVIRVLSTRDS